MSESTLEQNPIRYGLEIMLLPGKFSKEVAKKDPDFSRLPPALQKMYLGVYMLPALAADAALVFGIYKGIESLLK